MIKETVDAGHVILILNEVLRLDPRAALALVEQRVPCNDALGGHESVQVVQAADSASVGLLGVINGIFGADKEGWGTICAVFDDDGNLVRFERTKRTLPKHPVEVLDPDECAEILEDAEGMYADGFEDAFLGLVYRFGFDGPVPLYDYDKCIQILMVRDGMTYEGASECFQYNTLGAWVGPGTPAFARRLFPGPGPAPV